MTTLNRHAGTSTATPASMPQARGLRPLRPWALLAAALGAGLVLGGGWMAAIGAAGVLTAGLGLPWLQREAALGESLAEDTRLSD